MTVRLDMAISLLRESGPADARLEDLERTRAHWEAEMEAILLKADSTLKSASNAESRSRTMLRHAEKLADPLDYEGEDVEGSLPQSDVQGSEEERLQPLPLGMALTPKEIALRAKFA